MSHPNHPDWDHWYKGRWWSREAYYAMRSVEEAHGGLSPLKPGEGVPSKIAAERKAGLIPPETLKLMENH